jgi:hypothetical protein
MSIKYEDLQPHVDMLIDALENKGASSSGTPDVLVYPFAEKYRDILKQIRAKTISRYEIDWFLNRNYDEIMKVTVQKYRVEKILESIRTYFYKEFMTKK